MTGWVITEARAIALNASYPGTEQNVARLFGLVAQLANVVAQLAEELVAVEGVINQQGQP